jgi:hypothetical protein
MSDPWSRQIRTDKRQFAVREVPPSEYKPRTRHSLKFDEVDKTYKITAEEYMPDGRQYDVVVNSGGASLRLTETELKKQGFTRDPYTLQVDTGAMIPDDKDMVKVSLDSEEIIL